MFGSKSDEAEKLVAEKKWDKLQKKYVLGDDASRLAAAEALKNGVADEAYNFLIDLLKDSNQDVQLAAIKSLGVAGTDRAVAQLQWVLTKVPASDTVRIAAIQDSITKVRNPKR